MNMLVDCSNCHTPLQLPPGAKSFRCAICRAITFVIATTPPPPYNNHYYPPPPAPVPVPSTYNNHWHSTCCQNPGRKKAVIVGIIYKKQKCQLKGCINDAIRMRDLLISRFKFPQYSIIMLTEDERDPYRIPIKHNIKMAMHWLVQGCQAGDSLVFYYSGHGSQAKNSTGDEVDGSDETLCPLDHETEGMIFDNEINATIVKPLPRGAKLHAIIDACCSGTMLDLPYLCRMHRTGRYAWEDHRPRSGEWKGTSGGEVISFSGCDDNQSSADAASLSKMTSSFIQAIQRGQGTTYGGILNAMRSSIRSSDNDLGDGIVKSLLRIVGIRRRQEPQLTANEQFNVYTKQFSL